MEASQDLIDHYIVALYQLDKEGDTRAPIAIDALRRTNDLRVKEWVEAVHFSNYGSLGLGGALKVRVVLNRVTK